MKPKSTILKGAILKGAILGLALSCGAAQAGETAGLEERLAALEELAARQGPGRLSLSISGQVNRVAVAWDDGGASDVYIADNIYSSSRSTVNGRAALAPGAEAGFHIEIEYRDAGSSTLSQATDEGSDEANETGASIRLRQGFWWMRHESLGKLSAGQLAPATNSVIYYKLWTITVNSSPDAFYNTAFNIRAAGGGLTGLRWGQVASALDTPRGDFLRYDTPALHGFVVSLDWGENDSWDAALTFDRTIGDYTIHAALAFFAEQELVGAEDVRLSLLLKHEPSGLYAHLAALRRDFDDPEREDATLAYAHLGWRASLFAAGKTLFFGEYAVYDDLLAGTGAASVAGLPTVGIDGAAEDYIASTQARRISFGVMQSFDGAAFEIYAQANRYELDLRVADDGGGASSQGSADARLAPWTDIVLGSRIRF